jgi:single-stranded DNA-binding protein
MIAFKLDKGGFVEVIGSMRSNTVEQADGSKRTYWGVTARDFEMLRAKGDKQSSTQTQEPSAFDPDSDVPF